MYPLIVLNRLHAYMYQIGYLFQSARFSPISKISDPLGAYFTTGYQIINIAPGAVIVERGIICEICQVFAFFDNLKNRCHISLENGKSFCYRDMKTIWYVYVFGRRAEIVSKTFRMRGRYVITTSILVNLVRIRTQLTRR